MKVVCDDIHSLAISVTAAHSASRRREVAAEREVQLHALHALLGAHAQQGHVRCVRRDLLLRDAAQVARADLVAHLLEAEGARVVGQALAQHVLARRERGLAGERGLDFVERLQGGLRVGRSRLLLLGGAQLDLGGVTARLLRFGGAHTKGDELTFVEPDRTLISGDVVQNKIVPGIFRDGGTPSSWLAVLDKVAALNVLHVLPDHSAPGDGTMVALEKQFISDLRNSALELKKQGVAVEDAGKRLEGEFKTKYPTWPGMNVSGFVRSIYAE